MRLRRVSAVFFAMAVAALAANAWLLWRISQSYERVVVAQQRRTDSLEVVQQLVQETSQLGRLVRAYTATGEPRYLLYYYDILAVRSGDKAAPQAFHSRNYWDDVIAGHVE